MRAAQGFLVRGLCRAGVTAAGGFAVAQDSAEDGVAERNPSTRM